MQTIRINVFHYQRMKYLHITQFCNYKTKSNQFSWNLFLLLLMDDSGIVLKR